MHLQTLSPAQPMPEESELDAKFTELLVMLGCEMSSLIRSRNGFHLSSPPLMIDGIFIIIDFRPLRMWFCVYTPVLSRMLIYEDDVMMTFAPPSFGVCNAEPSLANFFFFLLFCCWISFLPRISPTKNWSRYVAAIFFPLPKRYAIYSRLIRPSSRYYYY